MGTDVWYYTYFCDETVNNCSTEGTTSPWVQAYPVPGGAQLWTTGPAATLSEPVAATSTTGPPPEPQSNTNGDKFAIYVHSFGVGNGSGGGNSPETSLQVTVQPPQAPTGLIATGSAGASGDTNYNLSWDQVTYPSTSVYYTVLYCDFTATSGCTTEESTWTALGPQTGTTTSLSFATKDTVWMCVQAENLGGSSSCSNVVEE